MTTTIRGYCTLCRSRCGTLNTVADDALVRVAPDTNHPTGQAMCPKGRSAPELVHSPHRVLYPMRRTTPKGAADPGWQRITWDEALDEIASRFTRIRQESGAEAVAFGVTTPSGTPMSDSIDWVERFTRAFGSPNIAYGTEVCNWHKDHAHVFTFGCGIPVADYRNADLIMLWGHNPSSTWLAQANAIAEGRKAGARMLVIDPRRTALAAQADVWLPVRPGSDAALALGLINLMLSSDRYDHDFVRDWTNAPLLVRSDTGEFVRPRDVADTLHGDMSHAMPHAEHDAWVVWDQQDGQASCYLTRQSATRQASSRFALRGEYTLIIDGNPVLCHPAFELLVRRAQDYTPDRVEALTGVTPDALRAAAELLSERRAVAYHSWSGVAQSSNATQTERAVATLYALTGSFDIPGGNRIYPKQPANVVNGLDLIPASQRAKALGLTERPLGPPVMGWVTAHDMYRAILDAQPYKVRAFMGFGTNQLASQGDISMALEAYRQLEFHVHCDLFETPSARYADIFLPVNTPWEREGLRIGFEITQSAQERVQLRPRMVSPRGESRSDNDIVFELARRLGMGDVFFDGELEQGWNHQLAPLGVTVDDLRRDGSKQFALEHHDRKYARPVPAQDETHNPQHINGFDTETRRVELYSEQLLRHGYDPLPYQNRHPRPTAPEARNIYPFTLTSAKSGYYCHSQHRSLVSLRKRAPWPEAVINASVAEDKGIRDGDWIRIATPEGAARFVARLDTHISKDVICAEYGWWQSCPELGQPDYPLQGKYNSNYNALISTLPAQDPISGSVPMRHFSCDVSLDPMVDAVQRPWTGLLESRVTALNHVADGVLELTLTPEDGRILPDFRPGQHITVEVALDDGHTLTRTYSLVGPARQTGRLSYRIAVRRQLGLTEHGDEWVGAMSSHLHTRINVGSPIKISAPGGNFVLPEVSPQPVVLFAGGIGITPFLSYLETLASSDDMPEVWLHYANRNEQTKAYGDRLQQLARRLPRLSIVNYYNQPLPSDQDISKMPGADVVPEELISARARFYMCGPPVMMDSIRSGLEARGVPAFDIFSEVFRSPPVVDLDNAGSFEVRFARSDNTTAQWSAEKGTLLSLAEQLGLSVPSGCRVGQCESCAVTLVSGQVHHLHGVEPDDPSVCLTCQAIPTSDIVLDT